MREKRLAEIQAWLEENKAVIGRLEAAIAKNPAKSDLFRPAMKFLAIQDGGKKPLANEWLDLASQSSRGGGSAK